MVLLSSCLISSCLLSCRLSSCLLSFRLSFCLLSSFFPLLLYFFLIQLWWLPYKRLDPSRSNRTSYPRRSQNQITFGIQAILHLLFSSFLPVLLYIFLFQL